jgi:ATP-dependent Clp protease ATP-binding subunit ClpB
MFNKFTNKSQEAIINAQIIAQDHGQQQIEAIHILASLLGQSEGLIRPLLEKQNINVEKLEDLVFSEIEKLPKISVAASSFGAVQGTAEVAMILERKMNSYRQNISFWP